jgi:hypothetical protein
MKEVMERDYQRIYYANGFDTRAWDLRVLDGSLYPFLKRIMKEHLDKVLEGKSPKDVLGWFDYKRARKEEQCPM